MDACRVVEIAGGSRRGMSCVFEAQSDGDKQQTVEGLRDPLSKTRRRDMGARPHCTVAILPANDIIRTCEYHRAKWWSAVLL